MKDPPSRKYLALSKNEVASGDVIVKHNIHCPVRRNGKTINVVSELSRTGFELTIAQACSEDPTMFIDIELAESQELSLLPLPIVPLPRHFTILLGIGKTYTATHVEEAVSGGLSWLGRGIKTWFFWKPDSDITVACDKIVVQVEGTCLFVPGGMWHSVCSWGNTLLIGTIINYKHADQTTILKKNFHAAFKNPATREHALSDRKHARAPENTVAPQKGRCCDQEHLEVEATTLPTDKEYIRNDMQRQHARRVATIEGAAAYNRAVLNKHADACEVAAQAVQSSMRAFFARHTTNSTCETERAHLACGIYYLAFFI